MFIETKGKYCVRRVLRVERMQMNHISEPSLNEAGDSIHTGSILGARDYDPKRGPSCEMKIIR